MSDAEDEHNQAVIFDLANQPVISNPVFPEFSESRTVQRLSDASGIAQLGNSFVEKLEDAFAVLSIKPA
jgi:hypothetical protein